MGSFTRTDQHIMPHSFDNFPALHVHVCNITGLLDITGLAHNPYCTNSMTYNYKSVPKIGTFLSIIIIFSSNYTVIDKKNLLYRKAVCHNLTNECNLGSEITCTDLVFHVF